MLFRAANIFSLLPPSLSLLAFSSSASCFFFLPQSLFFVYMFSFRPRSAIVAGRFFCFSASKGIQNLYMYNTHEQTTDSQQNTVYRIQSTVIYFCLSYSLCIQHSLSPTLYTFQWVIFHHVTTDNVMNGKLEGDLLLLLLLLERKIQRSGYKPWVIREFSRFFSVSFTRPLYLSVCLYISSAAGVVDVGCCCLKHR